MTHLELNNQLIIKIKGFFQLEKDKQALKLFIEEVKSQMLIFKSPTKRMKYLIENDFYEDFYALYNEEQIEALHAFIYSHNFTFSSYMSAAKFYKEYALKSNDKNLYLETYEDRILAVSLSLARGKFDLAKNLANIMIKQWYQPATPTFLNAGKKRRGEFISCFLLEMDDSLNSITFNLATAMQLSKVGGGVALNLTRLRAKGESIKGIWNVCKGVLPVMKLLEDGFSYADQMGQRKGAGAVYLSIFHYDIEEFLDTKKINADEKSRIQTLSLGVIIPDKFFTLAKENENFYVFGPYSVYKACGKHFDELDFNTDYDLLVANPLVFKKSLSARKMLTTIAKLQFESGYPYLMFSSNANLQNPLKGLGNIKMSNLCTEIFQIQTMSKINDYEEDDELGYDISCVLGSLNIVNVMENGNLKEAVHYGLCALTAVSDLTNIRNAPSVQKANNNFHSVGLGVMNLHGFLAKNHLSFESVEAVDFVRVFFMLLNYYSLESSMQIAIETGVKFKDFNKSEYFNGNYFTMYLEEDFSPVTEFVKELFKSTKLPTKDDWKNLKAQVKEHGLYHSYRLAVAPTQSISYIHNATSSVMPIIDLVEVRTYGNSTTYYPMPYLTRANMKYYKSAYFTDMTKLIDLVSEMQRHVDQGISTTLYVTSDTSTRELVKLYLYARSKGLKSLYYTRNKNLSIEECSSCAI